MKYCMRPVEVDAIQWKSDERGNDNLAEINTLCDTSNQGMLVCEDNRLFIHTCDSYLRVKPGDFVIRGATGYLTPCDPDTFMKTYMPAISKNAFTYK